MNWLSSIVMRFKEWVSVLRRDLKRDKYAKQHELMTRVTVFEQDAHVARAEMEVEQLRKKQYLIRKRYRMLGVTRHDYPAYNDDYFEQTRKWLALEGHLGGKRYGYGDKTPEERVQYVLEYQPQKLQRYLDWKKLYNSKQTLYELRTNNWLSQLSGMDMDMDMDMGMDMDNED